MSWRKHLKLNLIASCERPIENRMPVYSSNCHSDYLDSEIRLLLDQIGDRDVVVDVCLPPQFAQDLRRNNVNAIWVPAILGDGASDDEIMRQLLFGHQSIWGNSRNQRVLLTRDVEFYRRIQKRAILVSYRMLNFSLQGFSSEIALRKELRKMALSDTELGG